MTRASVQAGALYACEVDRITLRQIQDLRVISSVALNYDWGPSNGIAAMLLEAKGLFEPQALYYFRVLKNLAPPNDYGRWRSPWNLVLLECCGLRPRENPRDPYTW